MWVSCALAVPAVVLGACNASPKLSAAGGACFQATDCEDGLVCVPQKDGSRVCSSDLSGIQTTEEAGGAGDDSTTADGPLDGLGPDYVAPGDDGPGPDTSPPDTSVPPDTSPPQEAGD